jgi:chloramphenicol 3-O phosphotransferase
MTGLFLAVHNESRNDSPSVWKQLMKSRIIILNGTSSAGKSTLAKGLRPALEPQFCYLASDQLADAGFRPLQLEARAAGREKFFRGFHQSIAAFAAAGNDLLVEHIVESQSWADELTELLTPFDVFWIGVHAPSEEITRRERLRLDRTTGEGLYHLKTHSFCKYNLEVDSTQPLHETIPLIIEAWKARSIS